MIDFPSGFDTLQFATDIFAVVAPFVAVALILVAFMFVIKIFNKVGK